MIRLAFVLGLSVFFDNRVILAAAADSRAPALLLANELGPQVDPSQYLVSEKYDGVRALWDGQSLRFCSGRTVHASVWWVPRFASFLRVGEDF